MKDRKSKLAVIHIAKKQLALTDEEYRALLYGAAGIESASEIKTDSQYKNVMIAFRNAGYKSGYTVQDKQLSKCYALWCELYKLNAVKNKSYNSMLNWIRGRTSSTHMSFLRSDQKAKMIEELKAWVIRCGGEIDRDRYRNC